MVVEKDSFKLPKVTRFNPDENGRCSQLADFYNYVKKRERLIEEWRKKAEKWDNRKSKNYWIDKYNRIVEEWNQLSEEFTVLEKKYEKLEKRLEAVKKLLDEAKIELQTPKFGKPFVIPVFIRKLYAVIEGEKEEKNDG